MPTDINLDHKHILIDVIIEQANTSGDDKEYFKDWIRRAEFPKRWKSSAFGQIVNNSEFTARKIVDWALAKGINPENTNLTTLGTLLKSLLSQVGLEELRSVLAIIVANQLYMGSDMEDLSSRYKVPLPMNCLVTKASFSIGETVDTAASGPEINWLGTSDEARLEGWLRRDPVYLDVGFIKSAIERTASVCLIEISGKRRPGTGFLIAPDLVITNYHVLEHPDLSGDDKDQNARDTVLRFGYITDPQGRPSDTVKHFKLDAKKPIVASSPADKLDYVLLRVEEAVKRERIPYINYKPQRLSDGMGLNIIQHPKGETMKIALTSNGITGIYEDVGLIQYVSNTAGGSSGSPCFNDDWDIMALHHAERSAIFGSKREGILFSAIFPAVASYLSQ